MLEGVSSDEFQPPYLSVSAALYFSQTPGINLENTCLHLCWHNVTLLPYILKTNYVCLNHHSRTKDG